LKRLAPNFRAEGVDVKQLPRTTKGRAWDIKQIPTEKRAARPSQPSQPSFDTENPEFMGADDMTDDMTVNDDTNPRPSQPSYDRHATLAHESSSHDGDDGHDGRASTFSGPTRHCCHYCGEERHFEDVDGVWCCKVCGQPTGALADADDLEEIA
jgi:hypothetical protein